MAYVNKGSVTALVLVLLSGVAMSYFCIVLLHELFGMQKHFLRQQEG